jgi:hypothetical protein
MEQFKHEELFYKSLNEKTGEFFSIIELSDGHGLSTDLLLEKPKFELYFSNSIQYSNSKAYKDSIFVFDEDIYIYLSKSEPNITSFSCKIYYPIRKKKDVDFFVLNLKKIKKDGN